MLMVTLTFKSSDIQRETPLWRALPVSSAAGATGASAQCLIGCGPLRGAERGCPGCAPCTGGRRRLNRHQNNVTILHCDRKRHGRLKPCTCQCCGLALAWSSQLITVLCFCPEDQKVKLQSTQTIQRERLSNEWWNYTSRMMASLL
jgi:hypothetical protein